VDNLFDDDVIAGQQKCMPVVPKDEEAERALLGCVLLGGRQSLSDALAYGVIDQWFWDERCKQLWQSIMAVPDGVEVSVETLPLKNGRAMLSMFASECCDAAPVAATLDYYADRCKRAWLRRMVYAQSESIMSKAAYGTDEFEFEAAQELTAMLDTLMRGGTKLSSTKASDVATEVHEYVDRLMAGDKGEQLLCGYRGLDERFVFDPGQLVLIAGRPSVGKTAFACNIVSNVCDAGKSVAFFSLEMTVRQIILRMIACTGGINLYDLRHRPFTHDELQQYKAAMEQIKSWRLWVTDKQKTLADITSEAKALHDREHLSLVVVDYAQLVQGVGDKREQEVASVSRGLKSLALTLGIPVLALSQLNREVDKATGKPRRPRLSDLRESGSLEQDADAVILLSRQSEDVDNGTVKVFVDLAKNRNGPTYCETMTFDRKMTRFYEQSEQ